MTDVMTFFVGGHLADSDEQKKPAYVSRGDKGDHHDDDLASLHSSDSLLVSVLSAPCVATAICTVALVRQLNGQHVCVKFSALLTTLDLPFIILQSCTDWCHSRLPRNQTSPQQY